MSAEKKVRVVSGKIRSTRWTAVCPQPSARPVYNNRVVFGAGVATGFVIGIWVSMFLCNFIPMVLS